VIGVVFFGDFPERRGPPPSLLGVARSFAGFGGGDVAYAGPRVLTVAKPEGCVWPALTDVKPVVGGGGGGRVS